MGKGQGDAGTGGPHRAEQDVPRLRMGKTARHGAKGTTQGTHSQFQPHNPPGHGAATLAGCLSAPKHHPERTEEPPCVPSPQKHHLAGLTWRLLVSPWSQALLVCFCFSVEGRQKVNPSRGSGGSSC